MFQQIENDINQKFLEMTIEQQQDYIQKWLIDIYKWLNRVSIYQTTTDKLDELLSKKSKGTIETIQVALKKRRIAKDLITGESILRDGYLLLSSIGEIIRGEEILYSITVTTTGKAISQSTLGQVFTWTIPLKEFIKITNTIEDSRLVLRSSTTVHKMLMAQLENNKNPLINENSVEQWTNQRISNFNNFIAEIRKVEQWSNVNEGNLLEGFMRFENMQQPNAYTAMALTMKSPDKFFLRGDLDNLQIKGLKASVTNLNTLIQNMYKLTLILEGVGGNTSSIINKYVKKEFSSQKIKNITESFSEDKINELIEFFTSKIQR